MVKGREVEGGQDSPTAGPGGAWRASRKGSEPQLPHTTWGRGADPAGPWEDRGRETLAVESPADIGADRVCEVTAGGSGHNFYMKADLEEENTVEKYKTQGN